jgi:hypothetical protein
MDVELILTAHPTEVNRRTMIQRYDAITDCLQRIDRGEDLRHRMHEQRESDYDRAARRADRVRERLGWEQGILNGKGWEKPKGMHWQTFERLNAEHDAFVAESLVGISKKLGMLKDLIFGGN